MSFFNLCAFFVNNTLLHSSSTIFLRSFPQNFVTQQFPQFWALSYPPKTYDILSKTKFRGVRDTENMFATSPFVVFLTSMAYYLTCVRHYSSIPTSVYITIKLFYHNKLFVCTTLTMEILLENSGRWQGKGHSFSSCLQILVTITGPRL